MSKSNLAAVGSGNWVNLVGDDLEMQIPSTSQHCVSLLLDHLFVFQK